MVRRFVVLFFLLLPTWVLAQSLPIPTAKSHRIGLFIGTFDPPHRDHAYVVKAALEQGLVDYVLVIPNENGIHKPNATDFNIRHQMTDIYFSNIPGALVPDRLFNRNNHYLPNILNRLVTDYPESEIFGLVGTDLAKKIPRIYYEELHWMGLLKAFYVHSRPGYVDAEVVERYENKPILFFDAPGEGLSSSFVREALTKGVDANPEIRKVLSPEVLKIIIEHRLWGVSEGCNLLLSAK